MTNEEILYRLRLRQVEGGLLNCHAIGVHSLVLKKRADGSLSRIFMTAHYHPLGRLFGPDGHFVIGAHNHDKPLRFRVLYGDVWNVALQAARSGEQRWTLYRYAFGSALDGGEFAVGLACECYGFGLAVHPLDGLAMQTNESHTLIVSSPAAAWLVDEGPAEPVKKYIWSPRRDLTIQRHANLYRPMTDGDIARVCAAIAAGMAPNGA
jgi:hypothetical protein